MSDLKRPNFFIVGAPKCGTTAVNDYLNRHPEIFMAKKELHYFGADLPQTRKPSLEQYLQYFEGAAQEKIIGDASVWYLYSKTAAFEIKSFAPEAKILIMLRDPVQVIHSLHSEHLYNGDEDVQDFETAISLDDERREGRSLPDSVGFSKIPPYRDSVEYAEMVRRYLNVFGEPHVKVILYDDFVADIPSTMRSILQFLEVDEKFETEYDLINPNKKIGNFQLHRILMKPSDLLKSTVRILIPFKSWRHALMEKLFSKNLRHQKRHSLADKVEAELKHELHAGITELEKVIRRDLHAWK